MADGPRGAREIRAPGKLFWMGEYAVLEGGPALVAAVDRYAIITTRPRDAGVVVMHGSDEVVLWDADGRARPVPGGLDVGLVAAVVHTVDEHGLRPTPMCVWANSEALASGHKLGLGSSGAVAAGLVEAFVPALPEQEKLVLALAAHARFQGGVGSGADVIASAFGGLREVRSDTETRPVVLPPDLCHAAVIVGEPASTRTLIGAWDRWRATAGAADVVVAMVETARLGIDALVREDVAGWCDAVREYARLERAITDAGVPIVTPRVERCLGAAARAGWTAKPSGAGGGDIVVAFGDADADEARLRNECRRSGVEVVSLDVARRGAFAPDD